MKSLLIVEDDLLILKLLREFLKNYTLFLAEEYNVAIKHIKNENIDLCLVDYTLPYKNGISLIKEIKCIRNIPCILTSGWTEEMIKEKENTEKVDVFLQKPASIYKLKKVIEELLKE